MNSKHWEILPQAPKEYLKKFKDYHPIIAQMFFNRGIKGIEEAESFLRPDYYSLHDPFLLKDMGKAVTRIVKALDREERIVIFGDYDVDGLTATALLYKILEKLGGNVNFYIPNRMTEGYGLNKEAIDFLKKQKTNLIITVDNGIGNTEEVKYAQGKGVDVIICDHHEVVGGIPKALAVVNPKQKGDKYPFKDLSGVGVTFKLVCALLAQFNKLKRREIISEGQLKWYLDLVALGTIADMVPLLGENRVLSYFGLLVLSKTKNIGLRNLARVGGIDLKKSNPYTIGFQIGPRLNAAGRMAHAATALELLLTGDSGEAGVLALRLERLNQERQRIVNKNLEEIISRLSEKKLDNILVLKEDSWTAGVIGLIAGKAADYFSRPVFCMAEEKGVIRGSVRSSVELNVVETLLLFKKHFISYGGHSQAGGFSLEARNFKTFFEEIVGYGNKKLNSQKLIPVLKIEKEIEFSDINKELWRKIKEFAPFGKGNKEPIFVTYKVKVMDARKIGEKGEHLRLKLMKNKIIYNGVAFNMGERGDQLYYGKVIDIAYQVSENNWGEKKDLEVKIEDLKIRD